MRRRIVLLGPPASGKGTQAELITAAYGIPVTSPGAILRDESRAGTEIGKAAESLTAQGRLLPDQVVIELVASWLERHDSEFVMDGFPRSVGQADGLSTMLDKRQTPLEVVIGLEADLETLQQRVRNRAVCSKCRRVFSIGLTIASFSEPCPACGGLLERRADDNLEVLAERMREYSAKTEPLFDYYDRLGLLVRVDSTQRPEVVFHSVRAILQGK